MDSDLLGSVGFWIDLLGGVALMALAVAVARVRPRRALNAAFAAYASAVGLAIAGANALLLFGSSIAYQWWFVVGIAVGGASLMAVGFLLDRTVAVQSRRAWPLLAASAVPFIADRVLSRVWFGRTGGVLPDEVLKFETAGALTAIAFAGVFFLVALLAIRMRQGAWSLPPRVAALLSVGVVALPSFDAAAYVADLIGTEYWQVLVLEMLRLAAFMVCGVLWLVGVPRVGRPAVVAGLACFAFPALGMALGAAPSGSALDRFVQEGSFGSVAFLGVAILAYAIVRHQLFDIDVRVKRGLKGSTVAAIFVAVFFAVSEGAQAFFENRTGSAAVGIGATALLLFAIAPLQRLGDQVAERALPGVRGDDPAYVLRKKQETYRNAYAAAWADGVLTAKDARLLAEFKQALGLPDRDYAAIEREWAAQKP